MLSHKKLSNYLILVLSFITAGCAASYAPDKWLPDTEDIPSNPYGGWITVIVKSDQDKWMQYSGEFIAVDDEKVYILYDSLYLLPKDKIVNSLLELDEKNSGLYVFWAIIGTISTASHGKFLVITAPLWIFTGITTTVGESLRDRYEMEESDQTYWESIKKFARFPQGVSDIDLGSVKPIAKLGPREKN